MEKFWGTLYRKIYANIKWTLSGNELEVIIFKEWHNITEYEFNHITTSLKNIVFKVIKENEGPIP